MFRLVMSGSKHGIATLFHLNEAHAYEVKAAKSPARPVRMARQVSRQGVACFQWLMTIFVDVGQVAADANVGRGTPELLRAR